MKSLIAMAALAATTALAAQPAAAADSAQNSKQPYDVTSDRAEMQANCTGVWQGSAEALQGTSRLRADTIVTHQEMSKAKPGASGATAGSCGDMVNLEAKGSVYYVSADGQRVHGDNAFYDSASTTITITGDVTAVNGQNVMRGTKMVYNTQTGEGHVEGSGKGPGAKNRPRGVFYPKDANGQGDGSSGKPKKAAR
ncbi:MAG: LptA/OstA family protein [Caulobacterales bacterium]